MNWFGDGERWQNSGGGGVYNRENRFQSVSPMEMYD